MISDKQLCAALEAYENTIIDALPEPKKCFHRFPASFALKIRRLCLKTKHPVAYSILPKVACILLALITVFGGTVAASPEFRQAVEGWIKENFGRFAHYYNGSETTPTTNEPLHYELSWVPDGYTYLDFIAGETDAHMIYVSETGQLMYLSYYYPGSSGPFLEVSKDTHKIISLGDYTADVYLTQEPNRSSCIVWIDPKTDILFVISTTTDEAGLIKLAQHVTEKK